ncbi:site-specific recombinase, phage integrase family (DUF4102 domain) [Campylobacter iguaniorum]|uniref:tyrosine-type recombinase/integrase n=1 Tax=Campylobacter iguaniorum TaxID=1244531 RepID=UPI000739FC08|nr:tyrosine-type recombinase/integrase [Campylobacter iguaniorum]ALV24958.1 site-specific recombinase, phage integrase family (DUF4102 domain) [Campylobacter iguaniorum]
MPKISKPLTDKEIKSFKPSDKPYRKSDGKNLSIKILPTGKKFFELEYKSPTTEKMRRISLGEYPLISLSDARDKAIDLRKDIKNHIDPLDTKNRVKDIFRDIALNFLDIKSSVNLAKNVTKEKRRLEIYVFPYIGDMDIKSITPTHVIETLKKIEAAGKLETTKRIFMLLNQIYKSANHITHNIIADINYKYTFKSPTPKNFTTITDKKEIINLYKSIKSYSGAYETKIALVIAINTALRPFNVRALKWEQIDLTNKLISIKAKDMKMKKDFVLPMSKQVVAYIKEYKKIMQGRSEFLFANSLYKDRCMSENTLNTALRRLGYGKDEIVSHGFRAMFSTLAHEHMSEHKQASMIIEKCLAHCDKNVVRSIYNRAENISEMRKLMQWWSDFLEDYQTWQ